MNIVEIIMEKGSYKMSKKYVWNLAEEIKNNPILEHQKLTRTFLANGRYGTALVVQANPQTEPFIHLHEEHDEFIYLLEGAGWAYIAGKKHDVKPGDLVYGPAGIEHGFYIPDKGVRLSFYGPAFDRLHPDRIVPSGKDLV